MRALFDRASCAIAAWVGSPYALILSAFLVSAGFLFTDVDGVNIAISLASLALLIVLQASQNRDGAAQQAKLDEIIRAIPQAKNELRHLDEKTIDEVRTVRKRES